MALEYSPTVVIPEQGHVVPRIIEADGITISLVWAFTHEYFTFFHVMALDARIIIPRKLGVAMT